jgi:hypothetical protein
MLCCGLCPREDYFKHYKLLERDMRRLNLCGTAPVAFGGPLVHHFCACRSLRDDAQEQQRAVALRAVAADFRFPMYRQWNLYEAMLNSRSVAAGGEGEPPDTHSHTHTHTHIFIFTHIFTHTHTHTHTE